MPAIPYTKTATTDGTWDASANVKRLPATKAALRACHAWVDGSGDADAKSSYKFPHHEVSSAGSVGAANLTACSAIIAALNGGRGGAKIPAGDRSGVHAHAAGHLKAAGKDVPELKSLEQLAAECRDVDEIEHRVFRGSVELRTDPGVDGMPKLDGYAAVFNEETMIGSAAWGFREQVAPGAFTETIAHDDVCGLFNHDANYVLGRSTSGTLRMDQDDTGLHYVIDPPDTTAGRDVVNLVSRGDLNGSSFAFTVLEDKWEYPDKPTDPNTVPARPLRTLLKVRLYDVSPVTYPAYPQTSVSARAKHMAQQHQTQHTKPTRDGNGATGNGDTGDVGGDVGGMETTRAAVRRGLKAVKQFQKATRALVKALDISHGFNPGDDMGPGLKGSGGAALDTGRKKLRHQQRKALRKRMKALRDRVVDGDTGSGSQARDLASATMYYASRSLRRQANAANHTMNCMRAMCRTAGIDLSTLPDPPGPGGGTPGSDSMFGSDAGMSAKALADLELLAKGLELERLR